MHLDISNRVAVVTGAGRGIGEAIALQLAREGTRLSLWEHNASTLERTTKAARALGAEVEAISCDVRDASQVQHAVEATVARFGTVDILVNNAGIAPAAKVDEMDPATWDDVFAVNTRGVYLCSRAVATVMKSQRSGRIINASSFAAIIPSVAFAAYAASKSAVVSLTRVLAAELGPWNITVNAYAPGMVPTAMNNIESLPAARQEAMLDTLSLREWGRTEDVASLVVFLASSQARYITGALIDASGGKFAVQLPSLARPTRA